MIKFLDSLFGAVAGLAYILFLVIFFGGLLLLIIFLLWDTYILWFIAFGIYALIIAFLLPQKKKKHTEIEQKLEKDESKTP
ncbi:MAG: hypothetical protein Q4F57_02410 [Weeksellaceae bacterium]|nr:hypothetical protein [Weeksellaceae bacterium]